MMLKPKILVFIDWFVPGYKAGGPIRSCLNMMNHLIGDFDFYVVCSDRDYMEKFAYPDIEYNRWNRVEDNIFVQYLSPDQETKAKVNEIILKDTYSYIHINGVYSKIYSILPLQVASKLNVPIVISARGMLKDSAIAVKKTKKTLFLSLSRITGLYKNVTFHATNEDERHDIEKRISKTARIKIAPNLPKAKVYKSLAYPSKTKGSLHLISLARIAPEKNLLYALEVLAGITGPGNIKFDIYGAKYNADYWQKCEKQIALLSKNIQVNYKGILHPNEIESTVSQYHGLFLPTRGENFGHVILEAFTVGTPVLTSDQTPWRSLDKIGVGFDLPLDDKSGFVKALEEMARWEQADSDSIRIKCLEYAKKIISDKTSIELNKNLFLANG